SDPGSIINATIKLKYIFQRGKIGFLDLSHIIDMPTTTHHPEKIGTDQSRKKKPISLSILMTSGDNPSGRNEATDQSVKLTAPMAPPHPTSVSCAYVNTGIPRSPTRVMAATEAPQMQNETQPKYINTVPIRIPVVLSQKKRAISSADADGGGIFGQNPEKTINPRL